MRSAHAAHQMNPRGKNERDGTAVNSVVANDSATCASEPADGDDRRTRGLPWKKLQPIDTLIAAAQQRQAERA